ncbi:metal ABC transporter substrate-binding protein [Clostridium swellfunianum]|uniref:metal ABC transporter substrate-binding protein n=1 Tax=Clostridium swellfunianum TaxID=1367462 RepID=UPI00202DBF72|nr:metal ABC transporter substrate-binding protein [Clostridium swellfunianum]MCM0648297.1 metal ABC transporter substrate-binding protein [Clostridium swellfunianum]
MLRKFFTAALIAVLTMVFTACGNSSAGEDKSTINSKAAEGKISVVVSFNPLREFAEAVGGDKVDVRVIVPEGMEPHDFEPKPRDMENIMKAKVFVYNGLGMEGWTEKTLSAIENKNLQVVDASKGAELIKTSHQDEEESKEDSHEHGDFDPHIWLSLKEAKNEAKNIKEALIKADLENKDYYEKNYEAFASKLDALYNEYKTKFEGLSNKNFVTGHAAFAYLCRDFGLKQSSVESVFAEGEPTPQKLKELIDFGKANNIKVIFMEELASPEVSKTIANEVGAKVEKIYTIESREDNKDYVQSMRDNLEKIYSSLK